MERHNRKSHLAPQLSPSSQDLLRNNSDSPTTAGTVPSSQPTPTTGELPISNSSSNLAQQMSQMNMMASPREQVVNTINGVRPPQVPQSSGFSQNSGSIGRSAGANFHPGMPRSQTASTDRVPRVKDIETSTQERSAGATVSSIHHSLPMRPVHPVGPLPPPPVPRKEEAYERERRQPQVGYASQSSYNPYGSNGHSRESDKSHSERNGYRDDINGGY